MSMTVPIIHAAAGQFVKALRPEDRACIMHFNQSLHIEAPLTSDRARLAAAIGGIKADGNTALHTAMYVALDHISRQRTAEAAPQTEAQVRSGENVRHHALIVLTDGYDTVSRIPFDQLFEAAQRSGLNVYPIWMDSLSMPPNRKRSEAVYNLRRLAVATGARAYFPKSQTELAGVYADIGRDLSHRYTLAYVSDREDRTPSFRKLDVVVDHPNVRSLNRTGYYAGDLANWIAPPVSQGAGG
jgi:VWFA-related protein